VSLKLTHAQMCHIGFRWCDIYIKASDSKWSVRVAYRSVNGEITVFPGLSEGTKIGGDFISRE